MGGTPHWLAQKVHQPSDLSSQQPTLAKLPSQQAQRRCGLGVSNPQTPLPTPTHLAPAAGLTTGQASLPKGCAGSVFW